MALFPFFLLLVVSLFLAGFCDSHISYTIYGYSKRELLLFFYFNFHFRLLFIKILTNARCSIRTVTVNAIYDPYYLGKTLYSFKLVTKHSATNYKSRRWDLELKPYLV